MPATARSRWLAGLTCTVAIASTVAILPHVAAPGPIIPGFVALNQGVLLVVYALTSMLLLGHFRHSRSSGLLVLGAGSVFTALMVGIQLAYTPDLLAPGLLFGQGSAALVWLWTFWHLGPPLLAVPYAILERRGRSPAVPRRWVTAAVWATLAASCLVSAGIAVLVAAFPEHLPTLTDAGGGYKALNSSGIGPSLLLFTLAALVVVCWATRLRSMLQLWLAVSLALLILDNVLTELGAARNTVGWLGGRVEAAIAALVILGVYLREADFLYRRAESTVVEREKALEQAQAARETLEVALDASGMGEWEIHLGTGLSRRTLTHDRIFGYAELQAHWTFERFLSHVHPSDRIAAGAAYDAAQAGARLELECRIVRADDGAVRWLAVSGRTRFDAAGNAVAIVGCVQDTTDARATEERLRQVERMEAIGQLTGGMAHDFNNLLTVILGSLDLIIRRPLDGARVERLARNAFVAGRRGSELTEKLLAFSRRQVLQTETLNLNRLLGEFQRLLQGGVGETIAVEMELDPHLDPVRIDPDQFQAALMNLAGNARDAMPNGGTLHIATQNVRIGAEGEADGGLPPGQYVQVSVTDDGAGMDKDTAARAFEPFFTTKEVGEGTGLGLSQVYGFVQQMGGRCEIVSVVGKGCTVVLTLPRSSEAMQAGPSDTLVPLRRAKGGEVVLVVEDDETVREMAAESLQALGYGVMAASDARIALDLLRDPERIDILFSDIVMPGGMNGMQLANEARKLRPALKVLLTSGYTANANGSPRELPPDVMLLRKPYLREDLAARLESLLAS